MPRPQRFGGDYWTNAVHHEQIHNSIKITTSPHVNAPVLKIKIIFSQIYGYYILPLHFWKDKWHIFNRFTKDSVFLLVAELSMENLYLISVYPKSAVFSTIILICMGCWYILTYFKMSLMKNQCTCCRTLSFFCQHLFSYCISFNNNIG